MSKRTDDTASHAKGPQTRAEAVEWAKLRSISRMRRNEARSAGVLPLWCAFMAAKFEDGEIVNTDRGAWRHALDAAFPVVAPRVVAASGCHKCGGTGFIRAFAHIRGGQCFACA